MGVSADVKDPSTGAIIPIDGVPVASPGANPTSGQGIRQAFVIGKSDGSANYADPDGSGNLKVTSTATVGSAAFTPGQVTLTATTAAVVIAARTGAAGTGRISTTIVNGGTTAVALGGSGVTFTTGIVLPGVVGASATIATTTAIYGALQATGSALLSFYELY
jgi:hypothetical protein